MERRKHRKNSHFRNMLNCILNFRENKTEALLISKRSKFPLRMTEQIQILRRHLECISRALIKVQLDNLKSVFDVFRRKLSLGVPDILSVIKEIQPQIEDLPQRTHRKSYQFS